VKKERRQRGGTRNQNKENSGVPSENVKRFSPADETIKSLEAFRKQRDGYSKNVVPRRRDSNPINLEACSGKKKRSQVLEGPEKKNDNVAPGPSQSQSNISHSYAGSTETGR